MHAVGVCPIGLAARHPLASGQVPGRLRGVAPAQERNRWLMPLRRRRPCRDRASARPVRTLLRQVAVTNPAAVRNPMPKVIVRIWRSTPKVVPSLRVKADRRSWNTPPPSEGGVVVTDIAPAELELSIDAVDRSVTADGES